MDQAQKKGSTMERRKTMTMNWEGLGDDDDDDRFFETYDRLSSAVPIDLASSGSDDDEFDDSRMSFASAISSVGPVKDLRGTDDLRGFEAVGPSTSMFGDYNMWMAEPGSIKDRRKRLLQGMGLNSNKNLVNMKSTKIMHQASKKVITSASRKVITNPPPMASAVEPSSAPSEEPKPESSQMPVLLVRSRSDGDIESF